VKKNFLAIFMHSLQNLGAADISRLMSHLKPIKIDAEIPAAVQKEIRTWRYFAMSALKIDIARSSAIIRLARTPQKKSGAKKVQEKQRQLLKIARQQSAKHMVDPELFFIVRERLNEYFSMLKNNSVNSGVNINRREHMENVRLDSPLISYILEVGTAKKMYAAEKKKTNLYKYTNSSPKPETLLAHAEKEIITIRMNLSDIVQVVKRLSKRRENSWILKEMNEFVKIQKSYLSDYQAAADKWRRVVMSKKVPKQYPSVFPLKANGTGIRLQTAIMRALKKLVAPNSSRRVVNSQNAKRSLNARTPVSVNPKRVRTSASRNASRPRTDVGKLLNRQNLKREFGVRTPMSNNSKRMRA
jgi:hypothetical protein